LANFAGWVGPLVFVAADSVFLVFCTHLGVQHRLKKEVIKFYSGGELFHKYLFVRVQYAKVLAALAAASLTTQTLKRSASVGEVQQLKTSPRGDPYFFNLKNACM